MTILKDTKNSVYHAAILESFENMIQIATTQKKGSEMMINETKAQLRRYLKSSTKLKRKIVKTDQELRGFAVEKPCSKELCAFMGKPEGSMVARTELTKFLAAYIKEHKLQSTTNKKQIVPNEELSNFLGDIGSIEVLTHFSMQKVLNRHFVRT